MNVKARFLKIVSFQVYACATDHRVIGKSTEILPQTSVSSLLCCFRAYLEWFHPFLSDVTLQLEIKLSSFCWSSSHSGLDCLGMLHEYGNVPSGRRWEKTEHLWRFPFQHTSVLSLHFTQPRNDYTSRICPAINITLKNKDFHWPAKPKERHMERTKSTLFLFTGPE